MIKVKLEDALFNEIRNELGSECDAVCIIAVNKEKVGASISSDTQGISAVLLAHGIRNVLRSALKVESEIAETLEEMGLLDGPVERGSVELRDENGTIQKVDVKPDGDASAEAALLRMFESMLRGRESGGAGA